MNPLAAQDGGGFQFILIPALFVGPALYFIWRSGRKKAVLKKWAAAEKVRLIDYQERGFARGPFFFWTGKGQAVFRITVEYPDGRIATGWARCGDWFVGLLSDAVEVRWDQEKPQPPGFPVIVHSNPD